MPITLNLSPAGTYTIEDDGIRGNNISVVRNAAGVVFQTFAHPSDEMTFIAQVPGVHLSFNALDSFSTSVFTVGNPTNAAQSPDSIVVRHLRTDGFLTLVSRGSISEGGADTPADIFANAVVGSAATGIGTPGNAIETETSFIEAETSTGGINIVNSGNVQIGGISSNVEGLDVGTSGDLNLSTIGFIAFNDTTGLEVVHGGDLSGNVTLTAIGVDSDIFSTSDRPWVRAPGGGITLNAGRDLYAGTGALNFDNDILARTFVTINAGRDFVLDGTSNIRTGAFGVVGGPINIQAGRNISLTNTTGGEQTIEAFNGNITLTTGPGGTYRSNTSFLGPVQTNNDIILNADAVLLLSGGLNTTGIGSVTIRPVTPGRAIDIGSALDPSGALALSDVEFDRLFTLNVNIGDANSGPVDFSAPVSANLMNNLVVSSATEILVRSAISFPSSGGSLTLRAGDDLFFTPGGSFTTPSGGFTGFVDEVQNDGGDGGVGDLRQAVFNATSITLIGNIDRDTLFGSSGNDALDGRGGADTMDGGAGNDFFTVDNAGDVIVEAAGQGTNDRARTSVSYTLGAGQQVELLSTFGSGTTTVIHLGGNELANALEGNAADNILNGNGGADTLRGFAGNDSFFVNVMGDTIVEAAGQGTDNANVSASYTLGVDVSVETLRTTNAAGTTAINLAGNNLANTVIGNAGNNIVNGGSNADVLQGLGGNDSYVVDSTLDVVVEAVGGQGTDNVSASLSYTLAAGVSAETLRTINPAATTVIHLTGNEINNFVTGNAAYNQINGGLGNDTLTGNAGGDFFLFNTTLNATTNVDTITDFSVPADGMRLKAGVFAGLPTGMLAADAFHTGAAAADAEDRIIYNNLNGALSFDSNGSAAGGMTKFAQLAAGLLLTAADFVVI